MASKAKMLGQADKQTETAVEEGDGLLHSTCEQEIRIRGYEIYLQRGDSQAMNWRIGSSLNVSSLRNRAAQHQSDLVKICAEDEFRSG